MSKTEKKCPETAVTVQSTNKLAQNNDSTTDKEIQQEFINAVEEGTENFKTMGRNGKPCAFHGLSVTSTYREVVRACYLEYRNARVQMKQKGKLVDRCSVRKIVMYVYIKFAHAYIEGLKEREQAKK